MKAKKVYKIREKLHCMGQEARNDQIFLRDLMNRPEYDNDTNPDIDLGIGAIDFILQNLDDQKTRIAEIREILLPEQRKLAKQRQQRQKDDIKKLAQFARESVIETAVEIARAKGIIRTKKGE